MTTDHNESTDAFIYNDFAVDRYFSKRHKLSNGQVCEIRFYLDDDTAGYDRFYVAFAVANKKKHLSTWFDGRCPALIDFKITGTAGVEALIWCKDQILSFEQKVLELFAVFYSEHPSQEIQIIIGADDTRRFRAYRYMKRYGYIETRTPGIGFGRSLVKKITPERRRCG